MAARSASRRAASAAPSTTADAAGPGPVDLIGSPSALTGRIPLSNSGPQRLVLRSGTLSIKGRATIAFPLGVVLRPGTSTEVPLSLDLGSAFPAGRHVGELAVGDFRLAVTITVQESVSVELTPSSVVAAVGRRELAVTVRNDGNVAIPIAAHTRGRLVSHDASEAATSTTSRSPDDGCDADLHLSKSVVLEPGGKRTLDAVLMVPSGLDATRRYRAVVPLGPADLVVIVLPTDPPDAGPDPVPTARS